MAWVHRIVDSRMPKAAKIAFEFLSNPEPSLHPEGVNALQDLLEQGLPPEVSGIGVIQAALRVQEQHGTSPATQQIARTALEKIRRAGQLVLQVLVPEVETLEDSGGRVYSAFVVRIGIGYGIGSPGLEERTCHQVRKRYSDFDTLQRKLGKEGPTGFPPKRMFGKMAPDFVEERRKGLEAWVGEVVTAQAALTSDECADFLGVP